MANDRSIIIDIERRANALFKILERAYGEGTGIGTVVVRSLRNFQRAKVLGDEFQSQIKDMADFLDDRAAQSAASKMFQAKGTAVRMERILAGIKVWLMNDVVGKGERRLQRYERLIKALVDVVDMELIIELRSIRDRDIKNAYSDVKACENDLAAITGDLKVLKNDVPKLLEFLNVIIGTLEMIREAGSAQAVKKYSRGVDPRHLRRLEVRFEACERVALREDKDILGRIVDLKRRVHGLASSAKRIKKRLQEARV